MAFQNIISAWLVVIPLPPPNLSLGEFHQIFELGLTPYKDEISCLQYNFYFQIKVEAVVPPQLLAPVPWGQEISFHSFSPFFHLLKLELGHLMLPKLHLAQIVQYPASEFSLFATLGPIERVLLSFTHLLISFHK